MTLITSLRIDKTVDIAAPPERVYRALTDPRELGAWFQVDIEGDIRAGGEVWMTSTQPAHAGLRFQVRFVELIPAHRVVWEWHPGEPDASADAAAEPRTVVTFVLEPSARGTRLTLSETGFDAISSARRAKAFADNTQGWNEVLVWLQTYVEAPR